MALTTKPITTISYNTEAFLQRKLKELFDSKKITDYRYIFHHGEDGDKDHFHVFIEPNRRLDTGELLDEFKEVDPTKEKPLGVLPFRTNSKRDHWIMYVIHDPAYLRNHQSNDDGDGKIEYPVTDIKTPFEDQLMRDYKSALRLRNTDNQQIIDKMAAGENLLNIAYQLDVNPQRINAIMQLYRLQSMADIETGILKTKSREAEAIQKALGLFGEVTVEEDIGSIKHDKRLGITKIEETTYKINDDTGEIETSKEIKIADDDGNLWEGLDEEKQA